ncbi:MAG: hypothetical protein L6R19_13880, partial [Alphaproteobacteria bacterium]|nr:hypothetical protein [Alphaproteobacteria bacterium]
LVAIRDDAAIRTSRKSEPSRRAAAAATPTRALRRVGRDVAQVVAGRQLHAAGAIRSVDDETRFHSMVRSIMTPAGPGHLLTRMDAGQALPDLAAVI